MKDIYREKRKLFYNSLLTKHYTNNHNNNIEFFLIVHVVPDMVEFISALNQLGKVVHILAIPYSTDKSTYEYLLSSGYSIDSPSLEQLLTPDQLSQQVDNKLSDKSKYIFIEVGGYLSRTIAYLPEIIRQNTLGIIEDTEAGHRAYEAINDDLPFPIYSVARSDLKESEDMLIGIACINALENILREIGVLFYGQSVLIIGFGKIGKGIAKVIKRHHSANVMIHDQNPKQKILALCEGYQIPSLDKSLHNSEVILGTTGNYSINSSNIDKIKPGSILVSCSSKQLEFDMDFIKKHFNQANINNSIDKFWNKETSFYIVGDGLPINFVEKKYLSSPIISLLHGETLLAVCNLIELNLPNSIIEVNQTQKNQLCESWIEYFCDPETGRYKNV